MIPEAITAVVVTKGKTFLIYLGISAPLIAFIDLLGININLFLAWLVLMGIDLILATSIYFWDNSFSSSSLQRGLAKKMTYLLIVSAVITVGAISPDMGVSTALPIASSFVIGMFAAADFISIIRHAYTILFKERLPESQVIRNLLKKLISTTTITTTTATATETIATTATTTETVKTVTPSP